MVWFEGRAEPDRFVLADRGLYDAFQRWLKDGEAAPPGWHYEHDNGSETAINFRQVAYMTVRPQPDSPAEPPPAHSPEQIINS